MMIKMKTIVIFLSSLKIKFNLSNIIVIKTLHPDIKNSKIPSIWHFMYAFGWRDYGRSDEVESRV